MTCRFKLWFRVWDQCIFAILVLVKLSTEEKTKIVPILEINYKTCKEAIGIFNSRHPDKLLELSKM